jgi:hypothetical protein
MSESVSAVIHLWSGSGYWSVNQFTTREQIPRKLACREVGEKRGSKTGSLCLVVIGRPLQNLHKCDTPHVLDHLLLALGLMYASSFLPLLDARLSITSESASTRQCLDHPTLLIFKPSIAPQW